MSYRSHRTIRLAEPGRWAGGAVAAAGWMAVATALLWSASAPAQPPQADAEAAFTAPLDAIPPDSPSLVTGTLDNGLRYYIRENREPDNRVFLRLAVNAGSLLEPDDALGVAHFLEHMAFNGTERFAKQELIEFMESIGMRLGPGVNAMTSFDETVYMLSLPADNPEHLDTAFAILGDWTRGFTLDPEEIEQERGVVLEEWRGGQGAGSRVRDQHLPVLFHGSRYAERLPIGTVDSIRSIDRESLGRFYDDWYRPDLMAVIAVGDFDAERIEALINSHLADVPPASADAPERTEYEVPLHDETLFSVVADPEVPNTTVQLAFKLPDQSDWTLGGYRQYLVEQLYNSLLNLRFQEITLDPDAPFLAAATDLSRPVRASRIYTLAAAVSGDGIERGLEALLVESARIAQFGFTEAELERGRINLLRSMEQRYANRDNRNSGSFAARYTEAFLTGRPPMSLAYEQALTQRFVPEITLAEINAVGRRWLDSESRVVLVTAPQTADVALPDEAALAAVIAGADEIEVERYVDSEVDGVLLEDLPAGSPVIAERELPGNVTEWQLGNGVRVVLRPTDFSGDQVAFRSFAPGGGSLVDDDEAVILQTTAPVIMSGGIGRFDLPSLQRAMTGKMANVNAYIQESEHGLSGVASTQDLQTLFELIYLRHTAPRADENIFRTLQQQLRQSLANRDNDPETVFADAFNRLMNRDHPRARPMTVDRIDEMNLDRSLQLYRELFADGSGQTFIFVGAFDLPTMQSLVERYIGALPAAGEQREWRDRGLRLPEGVHEETVFRGREPRSLTRLSFNGEFDMRDASERVTFMAMAQVLQTHLRNVLREELGGTYNVAAEPRLRWQPPGTVDGSYALVLQFGADPDRVEELVARVFDEIEHLKREGPRAERVADTREAMLRNHETNLRQDGYWLSVLSDSYRHEPEPGAHYLLGYPDEVRAVSVEVIQQAMRRYLDTDNYVRVTLLPEG